MKLRIRNEEHIVTVVPVPGGEWIPTPSGTRPPVPRQHEGDLQSLRPAIYRRGEGEVRFRDLRYRPLG